MTSHFWRKPGVEEPPMNVPVEVKGSDWSGTWYGRAMAVPYKKPKKNKKWRWMDVDKKGTFHGIEEWKRLSC